MIIDSFTGPYRFLSNFFIEPDGSFVESEYQAAKCLYPDDANYILNTTDPVEAKRLGMMVKTLPLWDETKVGVMKMLVWIKFIDHKCLAEKLVRTGSIELVEGHTKDDFWGVYKGIGENHLGKILMDIRSKLT